MKVIIATVRPIDSDCMGKDLSVAGLQGVTVTALSNTRLEVNCEDARFRQVFAAIAHDGQVKAAVICAKNNSPRITDFTCRAALE